MGTTRYVWPAGGDNSDGSTWLKAYTTLAGAIAVAVAGDTVYCRGGETIAAEINFTASGTNAAGWIKFIGTDADGNVNQTDRYVINCGGDHDINGIDTNAQDMVWLENIEVTDNGAGGKHGFYGSASGSTGWVFVNCCANLMTGSGFNLTTNITNNVFVRCVSYSNTLYGFVGMSGQDTGIFCCARDNTTNDGFSGNSIMYGCISHNNGGSGFINTIGSLFNCVSDGNGNDGIGWAGHTSLYSNRIIGCRLTNNTDAGIAATSDPSISGWCYFEDNGHIIENNTIVQEIMDTTEWAAATGSPTSTNQDTDANINEGYAAAVASHNFATNYVSGSDPTLRRVAITIPWT